MKISIKCEDEMLYRLQILMQNYHRNFTSIDMVSGCKHQSYPVSN